MISPMFRHALLTIMAIQQSEAGKLSGADITAALGRDNVRGTESFRQHLVHRGLLTSMRGPAGLYGVTPTAAKADLFGLWQILYADDARQQWFRPLARRWRGCPLSAALVNEIIEAENLS